MADFDMSDIIKALDTRPRTAVLSSPIDMATVAGAVNHLRNEGHRGAPTQLGHEAGIPPRRTEAGLPADHVLMSDREAWLHGWTRNGATVIIGSGVYCAGCGHCHGVITVAIPEDWDPPDRDPEWPFPQDDCPLCVLQDELHKAVSAVDPWPRGKPRPLP